LVDIDEICERATYVRTLGVVFTGIDADRVQAQLPYSAESSTIGGGLHGGALMAWLMSPRRVVEPR